MDTAGYFSRDPELLKVFGEAWYGENEDISKSYTLRFLTLCTLSTLRKGK